MISYKKIAVTVPTETYKALERARDRLGKSRSEAVAFAIKEWLRGLEAGATRRRYVAGYLRVPETVADVDAARQMTATATADWSSWEPGPPVRAVEPRGRGRKR